MSPFPPRIRLSRSRRKLLLLLLERTYRAAIDAALALRRNTTVCTIYNVNLSGAKAPPARVGLTVFNDVILRVAFEHRLSALQPFRK
jgi:hypothetical protein